MRFGRFATALALTATGVLEAPEARAVDLPAAFGSPVKLDITETSIVAQRFLPR